MLTLNNSQDYVNEINIFESQISRIPIASNKQTAQMMLQEIKNQVLSINEGHASNNDGNIDPHTLRDNVVKLQKLRYDLTVFLKGT